MTCIHYLVECSHRSTGWRDDIVDEEEEGVLRPQMYALSNQEVELSDG